MKRTLSAPEREVVGKVADKLPEGKRRRLLEDLSHATAETVTPDGSLVAFDIQGYERPPYHGQHSFGVSGLLRDQDGAELSFDLYADENGRLLELEVIRWGPDPLIAPNWETLVLFC